MGRSSTAGCAGHPEEEIEMRRINLPAPAGNGTGAAVEVGSFMAALKTVQVVVPNNYVGSVHIEGSTDGGLTWGPVLDFTRNDQETLEVCLSHMRVRVSGATGAVTPLVAVGGEEGVTKFFDVPISLILPIGPTPSADISDSEYI
jgi:hypothetical protein